MNSKDNSQSYILDIAACYSPKSNFLDVRRLSSGNINQTFLIESLHDSNSKKFILQKLNNKLITSLKHITHNQVILQNHIENKTLSNLLSAFNRNWEIPRLIPNQRTKSFLTHDHSSTWRAMNFIESSISLITVRDEEDAKEMGTSLAIFHSLTNDLAISNLSESIPSFHVTPYFLKQYELAKYEFRENIDHSVYLEKLYKKIELYRHQSNIIQKALSDGRLFPRPIHGDPKVSNFLFHQDTQLSKGLVDFDTFQPGLLVYDLADCIRSCCNKSGEDATNPSEVKLDLDLLESFLVGYTSFNHDLLSEIDYYYLPFAIRLIPYELGVRFVTDYLKGNIYFLSSYPEHNLLRADVQFTLVESINEQWDSILYLLEKHSSKG